jgi:cytoskeleton protein RodZ
MPAEGEAAMTDETAPEQGELEMLRAGDRLRMAREGAGLSVSDIALRTRITQRHIEAIERSDFDALPGRTYVSGFARAYARAVDLDEAAIAREIRAELDGGAMSPREIYEAYEPADPDRVPSRRLAYTVLGIVAVLAIAYGTWRTLALDTGGVDSTGTVTAAGDAQNKDDAAGGNGGADAGTGAPGTAAPAAPAVPANAAVVLSAPADASDGVWIGFDDARGKTENWQTLDPGETLTVPADYITQFTLRTAKPQILRVTVNGRDVGPIGPADTLVKNVSLKPADLLARASGTAAGATPASAPAPNAAPNR